MSLALQSKIATDGLVFFYDSANTAKSWKGMPTTNLIVSTPLTLGVYAYASGPVAYNVTDARKSFISARRYTITSATNTARASFTPSLTVGQTYTFSFVLRYNGTVTATPSVSVSAYKGSPEANGPNTLTGETLTSRNLGNGWIYYMYTFTVSASPTAAATLTYGIDTGTNAAYVGETFDVYNEQFENTSFATPYANGTRTNTQAIVDLTNNNTITSTALTYNSDGSFSFNGSNTYALVTDAPILSNVNNLTIDLWFKSSDVQTRANDLIGKGSSDADEEYCITVNNYVYFDVGIGTGPYTQPSYTFLNNTWYNIVCTHERVSGSSTLKTYVNGVLLSGSTITPTNAANDNSLPISLGRRFYNSDPNSRTLNGSLPSVKIYNRTLSAAEVTQNFNALRGRYEV